MSVEIRGARKEELPQSFALRFQRYSDLGWISRSDYPDGREIDEYDERSAHFVAVHEGIVKGYVPLIMPGPFPIEKEFGLPLPVQLGDNAIPAEVSRFIVERANGACRHTVALGLLQVLIRHSVKVGVTHWLQALDRLAFRLVHSWHFLFNEYADRKEYMGSLTVPTFLGVRDFFDQMANHDPVKYQFFSKDWNPEEVATQANKAYFAH